MSTIKDFMEKSNDEFIDERKRTTLYGITQPHRLGDGTTLPSWADIFNVARYAEPYKPALKMMQQVERAGHGSSVERELLNLVVNYNRSTEELKGRVFDMLYGDYIQMYSYQGWETLTTKRC